MLALGAHHGGELLVVRLHAIGAVVDPAGVGIAHDHHVAGADVVAAVVLVPARHRNLEQVDVVAGLDVLQQRAARHRHRRDGLRLLHVFAPMPHQFDLGAVGRMAHRHVDAADRGEQVRQDAMALGIAGNVVEQHQRIADLALVDVDDAADLALALGAADVRHLAGRFHLREPGAQILLRRVGVRGGGARIDVGVHGRSCILAGWRSIVEPDMGKRQFGSRQPTAAAVALHRAIPSLTFAGGFDAQLDRDSAFCLRSHSAVASKDQQARPDRQASAGVAGPAGPKGDRGVTGDRPAGRGPAGSDGRCRREGRIRRARRAHPGRSGPAGAPRPMPDPAPRDGSCTCTGTELLRCNAMPVKCWCRSIGARTPPARQAANTPAPAQRNARHPDDSNGLRLLREGP